MGGVLLLAVRASFLQLKPVSLRWESASEHLNGLQANQLNSNQTVGKQEKLSPPEVHYWASMKESMIWATPEAAHLTKASTRFHRRAAPQHHVWRKQQDHTIIFARHALLECGIPDMPLPHSQIPGHPRM